MLYTAYDPKFPAKVFDYIDSCVDEPYTQVISEGVKGTAWQHKKKVKIPSIEGFAKYLNACRAAMYKWEKAHPEFAEALEIIRTEQKERLMDNGLSGDYNPLITKLILATNHGMKERSDITSDDKKIEGNKIIFMDFSDETDSE